MQSFEMSYDPLHLFTQDLQKNVFQMASTVPLFLVTVYSALKTFIV